MKKFKKKSLNLKSQKKNKKSESSQIKMANIKTNTLGGFISLSSFASLSLLQFPFYILEVPPNFFSFKIIISSESNLDEFFHKQGIVKGSLS
jgi:hypothetical protein